MKAFEGVITVDGKVLSIKKVAPRTFTVEGIVGFFDIMVEGVSITGIHYYDGGEDAEVFNDRCLSVISSAINDGFTDEISESKVSITKPSFF